ncbi:probable transcription factor PosF21, partial [Tanacetum coccineum]
TELEHKVQTLQTEATTLSAQLTLLQRDSAGLTSQNNELKFRLQAMEQQAQLRDALNEALTAEVQRLKITNAEINGDAAKFSQLSISPQMFQLHQQQQHAHQMQHQNQQQSQQHQNGSSANKADSNHLDLSSVLITQHLVRIQITPVVIDLTSAIVTASKQANQPGCAPNRIAKLQTWLNLRNRSLICSLDELEVDVTGMIVMMIGRVWDVNAITGRYLSTDFVVSDSRIFVQLIDFDRIELANNKYLIDVTGYVTNVGRTTYTKTGSKTLDFYLANQRGQSLRVTLWGGLGDVLIERKTKHVAMCAIVLTSMSPKSYNNKLYLSSSSSTVIYDNDDIPCLQELKTEKR